MTNISFLHTHYIPEQLLRNNCIDSSIIALEVYPDLLYSYYDDYEIFTSLEECLYWHYCKYNGMQIKFTIENIALLKNVSSIKKAKSMGLFSVQLFHSKTNDYFDIKYGLTELGFQLLNCLTEYDIFLDLSHLNDDVIRDIVKIYSGKIIISHCVCDEIIETIHSRSNSISRDTVKLLSERNCMFGIPFVNDLVAKVPNSLDEKDSDIMNDIISQIVYFAEIAGPENVALGPDFMDTKYFSKVYKQKIKIPDILYDQCGYQELFRRIREYNISEKDIELILNGNVKRIIGVYEL